MGVEEKKITRRKKIAKIVQRVLLIGVVLFWIVMVYGLWFIPKCIL